MTSTTSMTHRCGFVAVLGAPNAGKSTLVNALVGQKVAITSPKTQTTRTRLMGIVMEGETQMVLIDTPGIFAPSRRFERAMVAAAWSSITHAEAIILIVDAAKWNAHDEQTPVQTPEHAPEHAPEHVGVQEKIIVGLAHRREPLILVLNKVDRTKKSKLLAIAEALNARLPFAETFFISATSGDGVAELGANLIARMPVGEWHFPKDEASNLPKRLFAAEITREQLLRQLRQELPYQSTVETERYADRSDGSAEIHQSILVARNNQRAIILGKGGRRIKEIGSKSRAELTELFGRKVHLFLHVKVKPKWDEDRSVYRDMGLDWVE